jgi:hypothetical protein
MHVRELRGWLVRLFGEFRRRQLERELVEELGIHLLLHIEGTLRAGSQQTIALQWWCG